MEKRVKCFFLIIIIIVLIAVMINVTIVVKNPLRKSNEQIRNMVFKIFPRGSKMDYIIEKIRSDYKNWTIRTVSNEYGYGVDSNGVPTEEGTICVGNKYIRVHLGGYFNPFETNVVAFFAFDENSNLIEVSVRKDTDSL